MEQSTITIENICSQSKDFIAKDQSIPKVFESNDNCIIKLFRQRKLISGNRIYPYGKRFVRNAKKLMAIGIKAVDIEFCKRLQGSMTYVVKYKKLPGKDVRECVQENPPIEFWQNLAKFIADLHEKGIFFRGIHLGNILCLDNDEFALIDITTVKFNKTPLSLQARRRNLNHLVNYRDDEHHFQDFGKAKFLSYYFQYTSLDESKQRRLLEDFI